MDAEALARIQAFAAVASVVVAIAAVWVALSAKAIARQSVDAARRQVALAGMPFLVVPDQPTVSLGSGVDGVRIEKMRVPVINGTSIPAYAIQADVYASPQRFSADEATRVPSSQVANLAPGASAQINLVVTTLRTEGEGKQWITPFLVLRLWYYGPHGGKAVQWYDWDGKVRWRLRRLELDPGDGGEAIRMEFSL